LRGSSKPQGIAAAASRSGGIANAGPWAGFFSFISNRERND
jgi:hypothetical protein